MTIYTKKGDGGETALYDAQNAQRKRVSKDSLRIQVIGSIDELNSYLGIAAAESENPEIAKLLREIQGDLLTIGSITAGSSLRFFGSKTKKLEIIIDDLEGSLPVLANFVLPGGSKLASHLQFARSLTRKAERKVVELSRLEKVRPQILTYLNRLSDFLFMLARKANSQAGVSDNIWKEGKR